MEVPKIIFSNFYFDALDYDVSNSSNNKWVLINHKINKICQLTELFLKSQDVIAFWNSVYILNCQLSILELFKVRLENLCA